MRLKEYEISPIRIYRYLTILYRFITNNQYFEYLGSNAIHASEEISVFQGFVQNREEISYRLSRILLPSLLLYVRQDKNEDKY